MNVLKKRREHALLVFCFCESIFLRCSHPSIFLSFFSLSLLISFVRSFFYALICFIFFLSFLFFLAKETVSFSFLRSAPFSLSLWAWTSRQYRVNKIMTIFAVSGRSIQLFSSFLPKNQLRVSKDHNTWRRMLRDLQRYFFFFFSFVHKPFNLTVEIVESAYERKNCALASFTGPQIFAGGWGIRRKEKACEQAKNIPIQVVNT